MADAPRSAISGTNAPAQTCSQYDYTCAAVGTSCMQDYIYKLDSTNDNFIEYVHFIGEAKDNLSADITQSWTAASSTCAGMAANGLNNGVQIHVGYDDPNSPGSQLYEECGRD